MSLALSPRARRGMSRRSIPPELLRQVLEQPEQIVPGVGGRKVHQSRLDFGGGSIYLLRVIVRDDVTPMQVVTLSRTSKIAKYGSPT